MRRGFGVFDAIFMLIGAVIGGFISLIVGLVVGVFFLIGKALSALAGLLLARHKNAPTQAQQMPSMQPELASASGGAAAPVPPRKSAGGTTVKEIADVPPDVCGAKAIHSVRMADDAVIHLKVYEQMIKRQVSFRTQSLRERYGYWHELEPVMLDEHDLAWAKADAKSQAKELIEENINQVPDNADKQSAATEAERTQEARAKYAVGNVESESPEPDKAQADPDRKKSPHRNKRTHKGVSYVGELIEAGRRKREDGDRSYTCYAVTIFDEALGSDNTLWGADLERAMDDARAESGDRVRVTMVGESPVIVKGQTRFKKIWAIENLVS